MSEDIIRNIKEETIQWLKYEWRMATNAII